MGKQKVVKDKLYRICKVTGIPKTYLDLILMESAQTLRLWSYNSKNVGEKTSKRIFEKILIMDVMHVRIEDTGEETKMRQWLKSTGPSNARERLWVVHVNGKEYVGDFVTILRNQLFYSYTLKGEDIFGYTGISREQCKYNGTLCKIARDDRLELPEGTTVWDEALNDIPMGGLTL